MLLNPAIAVGVCPPVCRVIGCILNRVSTMNHNLIYRIYHDSHMGCTGCVVGSLKEYQVTRFHIGSCHPGCRIFPSVGRKSSIIPSVSTVIYDVAYKSGTVKACAWGRSSLYIRIPEILFRFIKHSGKLLVCQIFSRYRVSFIFL